MLLIAGNHDPVVDYAAGAKAIFETASHSDRYLLTYREAGHAVGLNPVPAEMRNSVWDMDWFEDQVWRQDRINAINLHFITAFLDINLRDNAAARSYLDVSVSDADLGVWNAPANATWGAYSPGGLGVSLWKGFQRRHARGMDLLHAAAAPQPQATRASVSRIISTIVSIWLVSTINGGESAMMSPVTRINRPRSKQSTKAS
jgi:hypothetical protein